MPTTTPDHPGGPTPGARRWTRPWRDLVDDPRVVGLIAVAAAVVVAALRIAVVGHGDVGTFVVAGSRFAGTHLRVPVIAGNGYDGQFYYRLALGPLDLAPHAFGIHLDSPARVERITYPALGWALAGGRAGLVPWSLATVNVVGLGVLGWLGGMLARDGGRRALWGLLIPGYFGFVWTLSRDLTEITEAALLVGGLLAVRRGRPVVAAVALAGAVLARETALVVVACLAVVQLAQWWSRRRGREDTGRPRVRAMTWGVPLTAFVVWQAVAGSAVGQLPLTASSRHNVGLPFAGVVRGVHHYASLFPSHASELWFAEIVVLGVVVASAARRVRGSVAPAHERIAWAAYGVMTVCLSPGIWLGDVGFRGLDDLYVLSCLVLLASSRRARWVAPLVAISWVVVAVQLIIVI